MTMKHLLPALLLLCCSSIVVNACDQCQYDGSDASDCKDYGLIDNSVLVAWPTGSQDCLDEYSIKVSSPGGDPSLICASGNAFVNELRLGSSLSQTKQGLGVDEGGFFDENGSLKDSITVNGQTHDCEANASDCYNAMKDYFDNDPAGQKEKAQVCDQLQNRVFNDKQREQSTLRTRLCNESRDGTSFPNVCNPLWDFLEDKMAEYPDKDCTGFSFGVQNMVIPGCEGQGNTSGSGNGSGGGDGSGTVNRFGRSMTTVLAGSLGLVAVVQVLGFFP